MSAALLFAPLLAIAGGGDPWADAVHSFQPGPSSGFGQNSMPAVVLGPPEGAGAVEGSTDTLSLGHGGVITLVFRDNVVFDGPGDDLVIFENPFHSGSESGPVFAEYAFVELSRDGRRYVAVAYDPAAVSGLAGQEPVYANSDNGIDPLASEAGGDRFDIGALGLDMVRYLRITDAGDIVDDPGNHVPAGDKGGFDLDAVAAINSSKPALVKGRVLAGATPVAGARVRLRERGGGRCGQAKSGRLRCRRRRTRGDGSFRFRRVLPAGEVVLRARKWGLGSARTTVALSLDGLRATVELHLD